MATKYGRGSLLGDEGVDYVALVCSRVGALFLARPRQDIGIDGHIEFLNDANEPTGQFALVQCKAGISYISSSGAYMIRADRAHFETWSRYSLPVIGIVYNPIARDARWVDLSAHIREHPSCVASGPFSVDAPPEQVFSEELFHRFREHIGRVDSSSAVDLVDRYLAGTNDTAREEALTALFARGRWGAHCCFVVHAALTHERSTRLIRLLVYMQSFYRAHPDRFYTPVDTMPNSRRAELCSIAHAWTSSLQQGQMVRMLDAIDPDGGLDRGSFGQLVMILFTEIPEVRRKLEAIVSSSGATTDARCYALGILVELGLARRPFLEGIYEREGDPRVSGVLRWAIDATAEQ